MNTEMMSTVEHQLLEVIGMLSLEESSEQIRVAKQQLVNMVRGLRVTRDIMEAIDEEFYKEMELDATWGNN